MFPRELLTDGAFWSFSAFYAASVIAVTAAFVWLLRRRKSPPRIGEHLPRWIAILFTFLLIEQFFHQAEHVTQMYQFGFLGFDAHDAHGFVWFLDDEWNHFVFNTVYMAGMTTVFAFLLRGLRKSSAPFSFANLGFIAIFLGMEGWHIVEHTWRISQHVQGLCDQCPGILDPLTGINRLVLHFWLNFFALIFPAVVYVWFGIPAALLAGATRWRVPRRLAAVLGSLLLASCASTGNGTMTALVRHSPYEVTMTAPLAPIAGMEQQVTMQVTKDGEVTNLEDDGRILHAVIASADSGDLQHVIAPARIADGTYAFPHSFTRGGTYRLWVEIDDPGKPQYHGNDADLIAYTDLTATGNAENATPPTGTTADGFAVDAEPKELRAGEPVALQISIRDSEGAPVTLPDHEGVMFALIGDHFTFFRHGHFDTTSDDGFSAQLSNTFPSPGRYGLWIEVNVVYRGELRRIAVPLLLTVS